MTDPAAAVGFFSRAGSHDSGPPLDRVVRMRSRGDPRADFVFRDIHWIRSQALVRIVVASGLFPLPFRSAMSTTPALRSEAEVRVRPTVGVLIAIGLCCFLVYNANLRSISAGDT